MAREVLMPKEVDDVEAFPRGRQDTTTTSTSYEETKLRGKRGGPKRHREPTEAGLRSGKKKKGRRSSGSAATSFLDSSLAEIRTGARVDGVSGIRLRDVNVGAKVWGCVIAVTGSRATLSLPHGLRGVLDFEAKGAAARGEPQVFSLGQLLRCVVTTVDEQKKRVTLSASLASLGAYPLASGEIVPALVESEEDHGWTLSFGRKGVRGFLPKHEADERKSSELDVKGLVEVAVVSVDRRKVVKCSMDRTLLSTQIARSDAGDLSLADLCPGMLVRATATRVVKGGLVCSLLSYFTATCETSHLPKDLDEYKPGAKLQARVLYVDQETKRITLSALPHLVSLEENPLTSLPKAGTTADRAVVLGADDNQGLLLELQHSGGKTCAAFCHRSNVADKAVEEVTKHFARGMEVKARVIGYRPMENMVNVTLKESVLGQQVISYEDVVPGSVVTGTVAAVRPFGLVIEIAKNVRGVCPKQHMSDVTKVEPNWGKFKVNAKVKCLVVDCDYRVQKVTLSVRRSLVKSELSRISSLNVRLQGTLSHGVVTGVEDYGIFVLFCGGVKGLAHVTELGLSDGEDPKRCFDVGQVVKCRVIGVRKQRRQLVLSLNTGGGRRDQEGEVDLGPDFALGARGDAVVLKVLENDLECEFVALSGQKRRALLHATHLSDSVAGAKALKDCVRAGHRLEGCAVLSHGAGGSRLRLTRKAALVEESSAGADASSAKVGSCLAGYVHRILPNKCVVRFAGGVVGIVAKSQISDQFVVDPGNHLCLGQTVRCQVTAAAEGEEGALGLTLKTADDAGTRAEVLRALWRETETAGRLSREGGEGGADLDGLEVGSAVSCIVTGNKDYGVVCDLRGKKDLIGLITHDHFEGKLEEGDEVECVVLDYDEVAGYVDLSSKPELLAAAKAAAKAVMRAGSEVDAVVQLVHENCLVCSLPSRGNALAHAAFKTTNQQLLDSHDCFRHGQKIKCRAEGSHGGRAVVSTAAVRRHAKTKGQSSRLEPGSWTTGVVESVQPLQVTLRLRHNLRGRLHATELGSADEIASLSHGSEVRCRVLGWEQSGSHHRRLEVSTRDGTTIDGDPVDVEGNAIEEGGVAVGVVQEVEDDYLWVAFTRTVRGRLHVLDSSSDFSELREFRDRFPLGSRVACHVTRCDDDLRNIDLGLPHERVSELDLGDRVCGVATKVTPLSVQVQITGKRFGRIFVTDAVRPGAAESPFGEISEGQVLECVVLERRGKQLELGLSGTVAETGESEVARRAEDFEIGQEVCGYVKNVSQKGCFVSLSRHLHAHVKLRNLSNRFLKHPERDFPRGKFVRGKVVEIVADKNQIELTLREDGGQGERAGSVSSVAVGDILLGTITRLEKYGAFCRLEGKNLTGLVHISELGEEYVKTVSSVVGVGDTVRVAVTKVDEAKNRVYLSMKGLGKVEAEEESDEEGQERDDEDVAMEDAAMEDEVMADFGGKGGEEEEPEDEIEDDDLEDQRRALAGLRAEPSSAAANLRAPSEGAWGDFVEPASATAAEEEEEEEPAAPARRRKREADVRAAEVLRARGGSQPTSRADHEKLVLVSPNDSYAWIAYMAHLLSLGEADEARKVAERALDVISYREQGEKHNVWIAYLNLEFEHGSPNPDEAAMALFKRGLPYNDGKKFHLALLQILKEKGKDELAQQVLSSACKKFRDDPDVWLASVEYQCHKGREKMAGKVMDRSLKSLEPRDHTSMITRSALCYYRHGFNEQARHMFESVLKSYPKRTDLWTVYLDQEIKLRDQVRVRNLFERIIHMQIPAKRMKVIFKKYMDYEVEHGDNNTIEEVKKKALDFVTSKM